MKKIQHKYNHWLPKYLGAAAITLGYTIVYDMAENEVPQRLYRHEMKHIEQISRLGVIPFYVLYLWEYIQGRRKGLSHWEAYREISFEKEAVKAEKV
jgi:hypothetical protein